MPIPLTPAIQTQITNQSIKSKFVFTVNGVDYTTYMVSWNVSYNTQFGSASATFVLNNDQGIFNTGNSSQILVGAVVSLTETFQGDSTQFRRFYGIVNQRSIVKSTTERSITLVCLDYISILKNWDVDMVFEATKVEITNETLVPQFLPAPNQVFAQVFNFQNSGVAQQPLPIIQILNLLHLTTDPQSDGFNILYSSGQLQLGSPINAATNYAIQAKAYFFYPVGLYIEDIIQTLLTTADGYGNFLFGETSAQAVINNHLLTTFQDVNGAGYLDYMTPNTTSETITINHVLTQGTNTGDTTVHLDNISGLPAIGSAKLSGNTISWTGINAGAKTLTGVTGVYAHPVGSYLVYSATYPIGQVWFLTYSNVTTTLATANFTVPVGSTVSYFDARNGRIILNNPVSILSNVVCNYNYTFNTLQSSGVQINYIAFRSRDTNSRYDAIQQLFQYLAPNYIIRTQGDNHIWASFVYQKPKADYTLAMPQTITYLEDPDLYTRVKFFATNKNPTNIMFNPSVSFATTGQSYKSFASQTNLQWAYTDNNGYQVYQTLLSGVGYITANNFTPVVYINGVAIDNQVHIQAGMPVTVHQTTTTDTTTTSSSFGGSKTSTSTFYYYVIHFPAASILPSQQILLYNAIGQNVYTISPNDPNMNYGAATYSVPGNQQSKTIESLSTATYWVQYSTANLVIDYQNVLFKINDTMIPDVTQANVTADFEYYTVYTPQTGVAAVIDGRDDTQVQTVFFSQPPTGYEYVIIDLGQVQTIQAIDITPGFFKPDIYRSFDVDVTFDLEYSMDGLQFFELSSKTQNLQLQSGSVVQLDESDLGEGFQCRYLLVLLDNVKEVNFQGNAVTFQTTNQVNSQAQVDAAQIVATTSGNNTTLAITFGVWPVAISQIAAYSDIILTSQASLIPTCLTSGTVTSATTTINVDSTFNFPNPSSGSHLTAYIGTSGSSFTYTGLTATSFLGCHVSSGVNVPASTHIYESLATTTTLYDNSLLLRNLGDRLYKHNYANDKILYAQSDLDSIAGAWLAEYQKDSTRMTIDIIYAPYIQVGQTVALTDTYNNQNATLYFVEAVSEKENGVYSLNLARYP